jgi:hypothetical protein
MSPIVSKIKQDIRETSEKLHNLKKQIRQPGHLITWRESADVFNLKQMATELCSTRAHMKHRLHMTARKRQYSEVDANNINRTKFKLKPWTTVDQEKLAIKVLERYQPVVKQAGDIHDCKKIAS